MELYVLENCANCGRVKSAIEEMGVSGVRFVDASQEENQAKLMELGGKAEVPFLVDGDTNMYGAEAIIAHLRNKGGSSDNGGDAMGSDDSINDSRNDSGSDNDTSGSDEGSSDGDDSGDSEDKPEGGNDDEGGNNQW